MKIQSYRSSGTTAVKIGTSRQVVIPKKFHDQLGLTPGDYLEVELQAGRVVMTPKTLVDKQLEQDIRESMEDFKKGRFYGPFDSAEEMAKSLRKYPINRRAKHLKRA